MDVFAVLLQVRAGDGTGESLDEVQGRAADIFSRLLRDGLSTDSTGASTSELTSHDEKIPRRGHTVAAVSHSSMIKATVAWALDMPLPAVRALGQDNCAVNVLDYGMESGTVVAVALNSRVLAKPWVGGRRVLPSTRPAPA